MNDTSVKNFFQYCDSLRKRAVVSSTVLAAVLFTISANQASALTRPERADFLQGVSRAIACEGELDDDLSGYRECINHSLADRQSSAVTQLGMRFQGWIIADLMSHQHATGAAAFASTLRVEIQRTLRDRQIALEALCKLKSMPCHAVNAGLSVRAGRLRQ